MMKKVMLILTLILLAGCAGFGPGSQSTGREDFYPEYRTGSQGLYMNFVPNLPPTRLFDNEEFQAVINLENRGVYPLGGPGDRIYLSGFDPSIISGTLVGGEAIPTLEPRSQFVPQGGFDRVSFEGTIASLGGKNIDRYPARVLATACYGYKTVASGAACIDPQPFAATTKEKVCYPRPVSLGGGQGAPVAVTNIEVEPSPGRTRFKIHVANVGGGDVFRYGAGYLQKCSPFTEQLAFDEIDYVQLEDVSIGGFSITPTCRPLDDNHIRLTNGRGNVFCEFATRGQDAYTSPITVTLGYGYRDNIYTDFEILPLY